MRAHDVFADQRAALQQVITDVREMIATMPEETHGQTVRLEAWCTATSQFLDSRYWHGACDVEAAQERAQRAARVEQQATEAAAIKTTARLKADGEITETAKAHARHYPAPPLDA